MKLTAKHFAQFQLYCKEWIGRFGLHDWEIAFVQEPLAEDIAHVYYVYESRKAMFRLNTDIPDTESTAKIETLLKLWANHEALELLLAPLALIAQCRQYNEEEFNSEVHAVIHRLQHVLL